MTGHRRRVAVAAVALMLLLCAQPIAQAVADDYPSWDEVQAAKTDVAARDAEAAKLSGLVAGLQSKAAALGDAATKAAGEAAKAEAAHQAAENRARAIEAEAAKAKQDAAEAEALFGRAVAVQSRSADGNAGAELLVGGTTGDPAATLAALTQLGRFTDLFSAVAARARAAKSEAAALSDQAAVAERERARLAQESKNRAEAARQAHEAAEAELAAQQGTLKTLYAQLASLRNRTAELERRYEIGVQAREEAAAQAAAVAAANGSDWVPAPPPGMNVDPDAAKAYASGQMGSYGWGGSQFDCLLELWTRESGWRADAYNPDSYAYGIPQALPGSKMATAGADWRTNANTQIDWGLAYISGRYGSPCGAWAHEGVFNWY